MFERLRRGSSGERKDKTVVSLREHLFKHQMDEIVRPGLNPKLQRALHEQNEDDRMSYVDALGEQRGEPPMRADGLPLHLGLVDPETGCIVQPPNETYDEIDDEDPGPYTPPPPPSVA